MKKLSLLVVLIALVFSFSGSANAQGGHEYAPLQEKEFEYKNSAFKNIQTGETVDLRAFAKDKKLVMVVYYAAWCPNWKNENPVAERLYQKYKDKGFDVIGVSEYASAADAKKNIADTKTSFTVVVESEKSEDRDKTTHYAYRQATGDTRKWGSPWNIFLAPDNLTKKGDTLAKKAFVVNGELIEADVEAFIRKKLGLPAETKPATGTAELEKPEVCAEPTAFKKP